MAEITTLMSRIKSENIGVGRGGGGGGQGGARGGPGPHNNLRGEANIPFGPQYSTHLFLQFLCETGKNHKCIK